MEQILIPVVTAAVGYAIANWKDLLGWRTKSSRDDLALYEELQHAVKSARQDILELYKIIDSMEAQNSFLKTENMVLKKERDSFRELADTARRKLDEMSTYVNELEQQLQKQFHQPQQNPPKNRKG